MPDGRVAEQLLQLLTKLLRAAIVDLAFKGYNQRILTPFGLKHRQAS